MESKKKNIKKEKHDKNKTIKDTYNEIIDFVLQDNSEEKTSNKVIEYRLKKIRQLFSSKNNSELIYKMKSEFLKELTP